MNEMMMMAYINCPN